ncbi:uncharacterized protein [Canis lupus baileyi]|uniref:uncharacterized protein isoform X2 n=1 Tax=Canis lupus baileyi TaxID=143281 RepID=UPI003B96A54F
MQTECEKERKTTIVSSLSASGKSPQKIICDMVKGSRFGGRQIFLLNCCNLRHLTISQHHKKKESTLKYNKLKGNLMDASGSLYHTPWPTYDFSHSRTDRWFCASWGSLHLSSIQTQELQCLNEYGIHFTEEELEAQRVSGVQYSDSTLPCISWCSSQVSPILPPTSSLTFKFWQFEVWRLSEIVNITILQRQAKLIRK